MHNARIRRLSSVTKVFYLKFFWESHKDALGNGTVGADDSIKDKVKAEFAVLNDTEKAYWQTEDFRFQVWCEDPICDDDTEILYQHQCVKYNLKLTETTTVTLNGIEFSKGRKILKVYSSKAR